MDPVTIALRHEGLNDVKAALRDVEEAIVRLDQSAVRSAQNASKARIRAIRAEVAERKNVETQQEERRSPRASRRGNSGGGGGERREKRNSEMRSAYKRAMGTDQGLNVRRSFAGPSIAEMSGSSSSSLSSLATKAGVAGAAFGLMKSAAEFAVDALKEFGGFLISDVIKPAFALETAAQQLENAAGGQIKAADIEAQTRAAALKHNMDPMALFEAAGKMIDLTGDAKTSFKLLDTIGTLSKGRGADAGELAEFAASLKNFDPTASAEEINRLLLTQLAQGDQGSVPLKEAAKLGGRLTAPAAFLAGNTDVRMASMGALLQSGRKGFGSTDELMSGIGNLINEVSSQKMVGSKKYLNADGQIGDVASLIAGILKDTGGDAKKIGALGLSDPSAKYLKSHLPTFAEAGKGDKGKEAVESLIRGFMEASTSLDREKENERKVLQTSGEKWNAAIEGVKNKLLDVMPEVQKFVDKFAEVAPQFGGALVTLAKVMIKVADFLAGIFGTTEEDINTNKATGEAQGKYRMNLESGQFEWVKQSQLNEEKAKGPVSADGKPLQLKWDGVKTPSDTNAAGNATVGAGMSILSPLLPSGSPPVVPPLATPASAPQGSSQPSTGSAKLDASIAQLDALGPKAQKLGLMFDGLTASAGDMARVKPIGQR